VVGIKTLVKLMDNLLKNPGVAKFGRVRDKNPVLKERLYSDFFIVFLRCSLAARLQRCRFRAPPCTL